MAHDPIPNPCQSIHADVQKNAREIAVLCERTNRHSEDIYELEKRHNKLEQVVVGIQARIAVWAAIGALIAGVGLKYLAP